MTEGEWLSSTDPAAMLAWYTSPEQLMGKVPTDTFSNRRNLDRKLRLWACACCRAVWDGTCAECQGQGRMTDYGAFAIDAPQCPACRGLGRTGGLTDPRSRRAVEVAEAFAEGWIGKSAAVMAYQPAWEAANELGNQAAWVPCWLLADLRDPPAGSNAVASCATCIVETHWLRGKVGSPTAQAELLRQIVGNPFHRPTFGWRTVRAASDMSAAALESGASEESVWFGDWQINRNVLALAAAIQGGEKCPCERCDGTGCLGTSCDESHCPDCNGSGSGRTPFNADPAAFAILADALEETGCTDEAVLRGLRGEVPCPWCMNGWHRGGIAVERQGDDMKLKCAICSGAGCRKSPVPFVRGNATVDLLMGSGTNGQATPLRRPPRDRPSNAMEPSP